MDRPYPRPVATVRTNLPVSEPKRLPDTLADLLQCALDDASTLDIATYIPYSGNWHTRRRDYPCEVCLAGCIIAATLNNPPTRTLIPDMFSTDTEQKLDIVDSMRLGNWRGAFKCLYQQDPTAEISRELFHIPVPRLCHFYGWIEFEKHLRSLTALLPQLRKIDTLAAKAGSQSFSLSR